jgi:hypothetical protein
MSKKIFNKGQRVVCVDAKDIETGHPNLTEGDFYTVAGYSSCGDVQIMERPSPSGECYGYYQRRFAPITEQYEDITAEIAAGVSQTKEVPDVKEIKQPVNN